MGFRPIIASTAGVLCLLGSVASGPVAAQPTVQPSLVGDREITVVEGQDAWVNLVWTSPARVDDFRVEVQPTTSDATVGYLDGQPSARLMQDDTLLAGEMDVSVFQLTTSPNADTTVTLDVTASYTVAGQAATIAVGQIEVRAIEPTDGPFAFLTDEATVASSGDGRSNWIEIDLFGIAPLTTEVRMTVAASGPDVYYPQETFTSLHHDSRLHEAEQDVARVWIDPDDVEPGSYLLTFIIDFDRDGSPARQTHSIELTVV